LSATSKDRFLNGRLTIRQSKDGFRAGLDAVMLAASVPAKPGETALELGSGNGIASLCLFARVPACDVTGVEIDRDLVALANDNARQNNAPEHVRFVEGDVRALPSALRREFMHVFCNPPFHRDSLPRSPVAERARASHDGEGLADWIGQGLTRTASNGTFTLILSADRLADVVAHVPRNGVSIVPLWPHENEAAKRILVQVKKSSAEPWRLWPGLVLHERTGGYTNAADRVLRGEAALDFESR
jgi:tRNA1Val (adenine37-N6)-methyltransferase